MEAHVKLSAEDRKNVTIETVIELAGQQNPVKSQPLPSQSIWA
jgi:hypothetical protein